MSLGALKFSALLFGMLKVLRHMARKYPVFAQRLAQRNFTAQIRTFDGDVARHFSFRDGRIESKSGLHPDPQMGTYQLRGLLCRVAPQRGGTA